MHRASRSLVLLLSLTVALAGVLAYEAQRATRSHRVTAERALRDYATVAARELATATREALERLLAPALNPVVGSPAASPYDPLPPAAAIAAAADGILGCGAADQRRTYFALDFRTGALSTAGAAPDAGRPRGFGAAVGPATAAGPRSRGAAVATAGRIAVYGVKHLRYSGFAGHDAPLAAYGLVTCRSALAPGDRAGAGRASAAAALGLRRLSPTRSWRPSRCARPTAPRCSASAPRPMPRTPATP